MVKTTIAATFFAITASAATYDLTADWSNSSNPNGPWSINQGSTALPFTPNWNAANSVWPASCVQPAWAPSNVAGRDIPALFQTIPCSSLYFSTDMNSPSAPNVVPGDIVLHTNDPGNGNPTLGHATIAFTLPASASGAYVINGALWDAGLHPPANQVRPQDWKLSLNGSMIASGTLNGSVSRSRAQTINLPANLASGDKLELQIMPNAQSFGGFGYFVGVRLTIAPANASSGNLSVLPQMAFGGGWYTALYLSNTTSAPVSFPVNFTGDDGNPLNVASLGSSATVNLMPRGTALIEAPNSGPLVQGYISAALPAGVTGYGVFRQSVAGVADQEAVVPLSGSSATTSTLVFDDTKYVTGVAVVNLGSSAATVTAVARDSQGNTIGTGTIPLAAKAKKAVVLRDIIPGVSGTMGSVDLTMSIGNLAALGLRFNGSAFTSIPTSDK